MKLDYVEACGFRGFRDRIRVDFAQGFTVITGRNGVGKSTLCDAIEFAVTGEIDKYRVEKAAGEKLGDYVWWRGGGQAEDHYVTVGFRNGDGTGFVIRRTRKSGADQDAACIEEALCVAGAKPEKALRQICRTSIIRDELIAALSLDLTETERFEFVRAALGAIEGPDYATKARQVLLGSEASQAALERDYEDARTRLTTALTGLAEAREAALRVGDVAAAISHLGEFDGTDGGDLAERIQAARGELTKRRIELSDIGGLVGEARDLAALRARSADAAFRTAHLEANAALDGAREALAAADRQRATAEGRLDAEREADALAAALAALIEHGSRVGLHDHRCPLCDAARTVPEFEAGVAAARERLANLSSSVMEAQEAFGASDSARDAAQRDLQVAEGRVRQFDDIELDLVVREMLLSNEVGQRGLDPAMAGDPDALDAALQRERSRLIDLERSILTLEASQAIGQVTTLEGRIATLREQADAAGDRLDRSRSAVGSARALDRTVKRANAEIIDERLAVISPLLNEFYQRLRPHGEWKNIEYSIRGDVKRFLSLKVGDDLNPQFVFSSGQRRAAGLAFLLSVHVSRPWCHWRTLMLDDPVQHIDDFRALHLVEVLGALQRTGRQIVCAVEDPSLADLLCRRLTGEPTAPGRRYDLDIGTEGVASIVRMTEIEHTATRVLSRS